MAQTNQRRRSLLQDDGRDLRLGAFLGSIGVLTVVIAPVAALTHSTTVVQAIGFGLPVVLAIAGLASRQLAVDDATAESWSKAVRVTFYVLGGAFGMLLLAVFFYPLLIPWKQQPEDACVCLDAPRLVETFGLSFGVAALIVLQTMLLVGIAGCFVNTFRILRR